MAGHVTLLANENGPDRRNNFSGNLKVVSYLSQKRTTSTFGTCPLIGPWMDLYFLSQPLLTKSLSFFFQFTPLILQGKIIVTSYL